jgi:hypothetical protein
MSFSCTEAVVIVAAPAQKKSRKSLSFAQKLEAVAAYKLKAKSKLRQEEEERPGGGGRQRHAGMARYLGKHPHFVAIL